MDEIARGGKSAIEIDRGDHGFADIGENARIARGTRGRLRARNYHEPFEPDRGGDPGQRLAPYQLGQSSRQMSLGFISEARPQQIGNDQTQHPVAQKLQSFIPALGG